MASRRQASVQGRSGRPHRSDMPPPPVTSRIDPSPPSNLELRPNSAASTSTAVSVNQQQINSQSSYNTKLPSERVPAVEQGTNIQVVVRCRAPSKAEIAEGTPVVVSANGTRGTNIDVTTNAAAQDVGNTFGVVNTPPSRAYVFDHTFGPEAEQAMIYQDVVVPMLKEVLDGFNCTIFAYGQTGTGKTYTMQGDMVPTLAGTPSAEAGIVPRALSRLFQKLEAESADYSVRISYMELYNEELRDLLAPDLGIPQGDAQPMSQGQNGNSAGLKIFDEASKKGVTVQGLEEFGARDASQALKILHKGSQRRQIAATKLNDHSSRSHSIFTITVHIKESNSKGEDVIKIGKLNLVDLAGSENIGRSGAENKRAKEAGMINQSLLTLGRVINALVDRSSHVPYRESKLTRLLQDSLGGRTKTCIIATISPVKSNMEETLSTLDYAMRAKAIKNKPELNQRVTKNGLLKEYVAEIDRLKLDLLATRTQNGRYFDEEQWAETEAEHELVKRQFDESRRARELIESQLLTVREEFEHNFLLLTRKDAELREAKDDLVTRTSQLAHTEEELDSVKVSLQEEVVVRQAHASSEAKLDRVAAGLKIIASQGVSDVAGLLNKLERKSDVFSTNVAAVKEHSKSVEDDAATLTSQVEDIVLQQQQLAHSLRARAEQFQTSQLESISTHTGVVDQHMNKLSDAVGRILAKEQMSNEITTALAQLVKDTNASLRSGFDTWERGFKQSTEELVAALGETWAKQLGNADKSLRNYASLLDNVVRDSQEHVESERKSNFALQTLADNAATAEIRRLQRQNETLLRLVESDKVSNEKMRSDLLSHIGSLVQNFTTARDTKLRDTIGKISAELVDGQHEVEKFKYNHGSGVEGSLTREKEMLGRLEKRSAEGRRTRENGDQALSEITSGFHDGLVQVQNLVAQSTSAQMTAINKETKTLDIASAGAFERIDKSRRSRLDHTEALRSDTKASYEYVQSALGSTSQAVQDAATGIIADTTRLRNASQTYRSAATQRLTKLQHTTRSLLEEATLEDLPTGTTPQKRKWEYADEWEVAKSRDVVLKEWRARQALGISGSTAAEEPTADETDDRPVASGSGSAMDIDREANADALEEAEVEGPRYIEYEVPLIMDDSEEATTIPEASPVKEAAPVPRQQALPPPRVPSARTSSLRAPRSRAPSGVVAPAASRTVTTRTSKRLASGSGTGPAGALSEKSNAGARKRAK